MRRSGAPIHRRLVAHHLRKPKDENEVPDKHDNKGSGAITDQVDNVMLVWRNKRKEDDVKVQDIAEIILEALETEPAAPVGGSFTPGL